MAKQSINIGTSANDRTGDSLRSAFNKINENFTDLYTALGLDSGGLNLGAFEFTGSTLTTTDSSAIVIDQAASITGDFTVGGDIVPNVNEEHSLGSSTKRFKDIYLSGSTIDLGGTTLSIADGKLQVGGADVGATVSYNEITDTPTIPSALSDLTNDSGFITASDIPTDLKGSVFADDSTLLVDGVAGKIVGPVDTASVTFADDTVQTTAYVERFVNRSTFTSDYTITPGSATILQFDAFQGSRAFDAVTYQWTVANTGLYRLDFVLGLTESEVDLPLTVFLSNTAGFVNQITLFSGVFTGTTISMSGTTYLTAGQSYQFGIIQKVTGSNIILDKDLTSVGIEQLTNA